MSLLIGNINIYIVHILFCETIICETRNHKFQYLVPPLIHLIAIYYSNGIAINLRSVFEYEGDLWVL